MKSVYFIRTSDNRPYILVTVLAGSTEFQPLMGDADDVTQALSEGFKNKPIKKGELDGALDDDLSIEGPIVVNRESRKLIASFLEEANIPVFQSGTKPPKITGKTVVFDISDISLSDIHVDDRKNAVEYKALAFIADQTKTTFNYEVKRVRAIWDPSLSIPGTNRRGGWRCPVGTRYGGQITDRFGRNCGWGVARRIANAITNIGERLEDVDDRRRGRRVDRRNRRMIDRLQRAEGAGRVEQGLRGIAERLEGGDAPAPDANRQRGIPAMRQVLREEVEIFRENRRRRRGEAVGEQMQPEPRPRLRDSERRRMEREIVEPGAERTPEGGRPQRPAPQRRPRGRAVRNEDQTDIGDGPRANESFGKYVDRKYREYEDRIAKIRREGGDAGLMTRDEWYGFNRGNLREAWSRANGGRAPREPRQPQQRQPRPRAPRNRRVNASNAQAQEAANRRPRVDDQPVPQQQPVAPASRVNFAEQRRRQMNEMQERFEARKREMLDGIPDDAPDETRRAYEAFVGSMRITFGKGGADIVPEIPSYQQFVERRNRLNRPTDNPANERAQRINQMMIRFGNRKRELRNGIPEDAPAGMRRGYEAYLDAVQVDYDGDGNEIDRIMSYDEFVRFGRRLERPAEAAPDAGGAGPSESTPDSRSNRNVFNQFREQGLPDTAFWRAPDYNGDDKAELERRFGRYYDNNNQRNERGNQVNLNIANGEGRARPQGQARQRRPRQPRRQPNQNRQPQQQNENDGAAGRAAVPFPPRENKHGTLGINRDNGLLGDYVPNNNPNITNKEQAVEFVKNGGELSEVPHQFWHAAISANSSTTATDKTKRFRKLQKNGGRIGETQLYVLRDADGKATKQGWVLKAAPNGDNIGELIGWNYLAAIGVQNDGAVIDGKSPTSNQSFVILPFATNAIPENARAIPAGQADGDANYHRNAMNQDPNSLPGRMVALAANYILNVSDRHGQNGFGQMFDVPGQGKVAVNIPWDLGWAFRGQGGSVDSFLMAYRMDSGVLNRLRATITGQQVGTSTPIPADIETRRKVQRETVAALRDIIAKTDEMLSVGKDRFVEQSLKNMENPGQRVRDTASRGFDSMSQSVRRLEAIVREIEGLQVA